VAVLHARKVGMRRPRAEPASWLSEVFECNLQPLDLASQPSSLAGNFTTTIVGLPGFSAQWGFSADPFMHGELPRVKPGISIDMGRWKRLQ
jgi:hypothetical protein